MKLIATLIALYQKTLSPDHGIIRFRYPAGFCRYAPSCSEYCRQAFTTYPFMRAARLGFARLVRCHPWSAGGTDPLPLPVKK